MNSSDAWYNDGYSFSQVCPDEETFKTNAETYFSYLKTHYDGVFGKPRSEKISMDTNEIGILLNKRVICPTILMIIQANYISSIT